MSDSTATPSSTLTQNIPIDQIGPSSHQARKSFDEEALKGLAQSMKEEGLIQAITVRKVGEAYELISGERRLRAAKLLGWTAIEAKIIQTVSEAESAAKGLVENLQREDLNPVEEAEGFTQINKLDPSYWNQPKIAEVTGRSQPYISLSLRMLSLPGEVVQNIRARMLSRSHGLELLRLDTPERQLNASKQVLEKKLSWEATRKLVDQMLGGGKKAAKSEEQGAGSSSQSFRFTKKGQNVAMAASFPEGSDLDKFLAGLRVAYLAWSTKAAVTQEDEELLQARKGPAALCAKLCGAEDSRTKMLEGKSWADFGIGTPEEGLKAFMEGKITEQR